MKKTLLLAAALAWSSMVQADSFICESVGWSLVNQDGALATEDVDQIWIVDSEKGWKEIGETDSIGVCEFIKFGERLECKYTSGPFLNGDIHIHEFTIWLGGNNNFVRLSRLVGSVSAYSGGCIKI